MNCMKEISRAAGFLEKNDLMDKPFLPEDIFDNQYIRHVLEND